jgi:outer membrane receptor protein involved in Fe transport
MGVEMDFVAKPISKLEVTGFVSVGDWRWVNDVLDVGVYDANQVLQETVNLYVKDIHVGDAAQTTAALGINYELLKGLKFGADWNYYTNLFADFDPLDRGTAPAAGESNPDSWELPSYNLIDMNLRYNFEVSDLKATLYMNVNNLLDTEYISDASDGANHTWDEAKVYYGWGRSWSIGLKLRF